MTDNFQYGLCRPWRARISTEFCRVYQAGGNYKCQTCKGLIMETSNDKPLETSSVKPVEERPPLKDRLKDMMEAKPATAKEVAQAAGVSIFPVQRWLGGESVPSVSQAQLLDAFFGSSLAAEYDGTLRQTGTTKTRAAAPKPEAGPSNPIAEILKTAASLEKKLTESARPAHKEVCGDLEAVTVETDDRQMALAIIFKALDCLFLLLNEGTGATRAEV